MAGGPNVGGGGKRGSAAQTVGVLNLLTDLAFNLLIFFVVCASTEPEKGRPQQVPAASKEPTADQKQNVEVKITRTTTLLNGDALLPDKFAESLTNLLAGKTRPEDRIVVVKSDGDTPYSQWVKVTGVIEKAGGIITLQLEEEKVVGVK